MATMAASDVRRGVGLSRSEAGLRRRSVSAFLRRCRGDEAHAGTVARLALALYDGLPRPRGGRPNARELLEYGALLHDVGYRIGYARHHKHGEYLIRHAALAGFSREEIDLLAALARYHRKRGPRRRDACLARLGRDDRRTLRHLLGILRVADALDRGHAGVVDSVRAVRGRRRCTLRVRCVADGSVELREARAEAVFLEDGVGRAIAVELEPAPMARVWRRRLPTPALDERVVAG